MSKLLTKANILQQFEDNDWLVNLRISRVFCYEVIYYDTLSHGFSIYVGDTKSESTGEVLFRDVNPFTVEGYMLYDHFNPKQ